jgi:predicted ATP-grasp superfamily ATP-dependent carboligase
MTATPDTTTSRRPSLRITRRKHSEARTPVLLAGDQTFATLAAVRGLRAGGYAPVLAHWQPRTYATRSRAKTAAVLVPDPSLDPDAFTSAVAGAAARYPVSAVLPGGDSSLLVLAERRDAFLSDFPVGVCSPERVALASDKHRLPELAAAAELAVPATLILERSELSAQEASLPYPVVVKALRSVVPTGGGSFTRAWTRRAEDPAQLRRALEAIPGERYLVQRHLPGTLAAISGVAWQGTLLCAVHQHAHRIWPPDCGTSAYAVTVYPDDELERAVASIVEALGWSGIVQFQFLRTEHGPYLIDLNPRIYGTLGLAIAAGLNLPAIWTDLLLGRRPTLSHFRVGVRWRAEEYDARIIYRLLGDRHAREALRIALPRRRTAHAVFSLRDPAPALTTYTRLRNETRRRRIRRKSPSA